MMKLLRCAPILLLALTLPQSAGAQGCVAIRSFTACNPNAFTNGNLIGKGWQLSLNYRYFESFRHFKGDHEETVRQELGNEVWNYVTQLNVGLVYNMDRQNGITFSLPYSYNVRSSEYEHRTRIKPTLFVSRPAAGATVLKA